MAKNKPADNQFTVGEKYLARIITARWTSLPTVGPNEAGLAIQIKLSVLCTAPTNGDSTFWGLEAVIFIPVAIDPSPTSRRPTIRISDIGANFLNDFGIAVPQYPNRTSLLQHNGAGIICEFGSTDPVHGYQSILQWELVTDTKMQSLITMAMKAGAKPPMISGLKFFPDKLVVTRYGAPVEIKSILQWNALQILASNNSYKGIDLVKHAWAKSNKTPPGAVEIMDTVYKLISMLNNQLDEHIKDLQLKIVNHRNGYYSLKDLALSPPPRPARKLARKPARKPRPKSD